MTSKSKIKSASEHSASSGGVTRLLPTGHLGGAALLSLAIWYAGVSQSNNAAFLLGGGLLALLAVSAAHGWMALRLLEVRTEAVQPAFAGQEAELEVELMNPARREALAIDVSLFDSGPARIDRVPGRGAARMRLRFPCRRRGVMPLPDLRLDTRYPLGFFEARRRVPTRQEVLVYPAPAGDPRLPEQAAAALGAAVERQRREGEDFVGVRAYALGESQRHIDWKAVARGAPLMTKQFAGGEERRLRFRFSDLEHLGYEARLSQLALWVIKAERAGRIYALELPGRTIEAGSGEAHFRRALGELARTPEEGR